MNDGQKTERISQTYKKYAKHVGKLYWEKNSDWDLEKRDYVYSWRPIMIAGLQRRYGRGRYTYTIMALGVKEDEWRHSFNSECGRVNNQIKYGNLVPIDPANPVPPPLNPK